MEGRRIRLSRFTGEGSRLVDLALGIDYEPGAAAYIVYPHQVDGLAVPRNDMRGTTLLVRLDLWDGENVLRLYEPGSVPRFGGDGCLVDVVMGYGDRQEIDSLEFLSGARRGAHALGLPIVCRIVFNPEPYREDVTGSLNVPLTIAEEMGADAVIVPDLAEVELSGLRRPMVPFFMTVTEGIYEGGSL